MTHKNAIKHGFIHGLILTHNEYLLARADNVYIICKFDINYHLFYG